MDLLMKEFLDYLIYEKNYSIKTKDSYGKDIFEFTKYLNAENITDLLKVREEDFRGYQIFLSVKKNSNSTISRKISSIRSMYNYFLKRNYIKLNPIAGIVSPKKEKKLPKFISLEEVEKLLDKIDTSTFIGERDYLIIELFYSTGIRISELTNILIEDISMSERSIRINSGKGNKDRTVFYGKRLEIILKKYLSSGRVNLANNNNYLVVSNRGNKINEGVVRKILDDLIKEASLTMHISPHSLRHTFATHLMNNGADIVTVKELLGHESLGSTEIYTHVTSERLKSVYNMAHPRAKKK